MISRIVAVACVLLACAAQAQEADTDGTTIVGEREAAVGLYLAPWQDEHASDLDRPPALLDAPAQALDPERFQRLADYDEAIGAYRRERLYRSR